MGPSVTEILGFQPKKNLGNPPYPPHYATLRGEKGGVIAKICLMILKLCILPYVTKILRFKTPHKFWDPPYPLHYAIVGGW